MDGPSLKMDRNFSVPPNYLCGRPLFLFPALRLHGLCRRSGVVVIVIIIVVIIIIVIIVVIRACSAVGIGVGRALSAPGAAAGEASPAP